MNTGACYENLYFFPAEELTYFELEHYTQLKIQFFLGKLDPTDGGEVFCLPLLALEKLQW